MAVGNNNQIEKRLWDAADELRANSKLKSSEYSIPVLGLIWRKTQATRAAVRVAVEDKLDELPGVFTREIYTQKCNAVYQHIFESYYGDGRSLYAAA